MRQDLTDITLVVDRSGSMESMRKDAEGGLNTFVHQQSGEPGEALLTLIQFDTEYEFLYQGVPVGEVKPYQLVPRGGTALLDAVGRAINETGNRLANMPESERPGLVIFVILTDGEENSSREFTRAQVQAMIKEQQEKYSWQFTYLGANQDAFAEASQLGFDKFGGVMQFNAQNVDLAYCQTGAKVSRMRQQAFLGETVCNDFTDEERANME